MKNIMPSFKIPKFSKTRNKSKNPQGKMKAFFSKVSKSFMLPIAILPIAGILLGIGVTIESKTSGGLKEFGHVLNLLGDIVFANLAILFAVSLAIGFTNFSGVACLSAVLGYLVFHIFQSAFLQEITTTVTVDDEQKSIVTGYNIWFWKNLQTDIVGPTLGLVTLKSGVIGGMAIGGLAAFAYNTFHKTKLPAIFGFFAGERFVAIAMFLMSIIAGCLSIIIWPGFGWLLSQFGLWTAKMPFGLDSLVQGIGTRSLIPFGLHHAFYGAMWWTSAGGSLINFQEQIVLNHTYEVLGQANLSKQELETITNTLKQLDGGLLNEQLLLSISDALGKEHQHLFREIESWFNSINPKTWLAEGDQTIQQAIYSDPTLKIQDVREAGLHVGRFISGGFPLFMFTLPFIGYAMITTVPKSKRKFAYSIYVPAIATAFLTGVTEPIEFTFLFASPLLYYGVYVPLAGLSWMLMNISGSSISVTFSQGFLDYILYGIIPTTNGHETRFWVVPIIGIGLGIIAFFIFRYLIIWKNIPIPGRIEGEKITLKSKKNYQERKQKSQITMLAQNIIKGYGGKENIIMIDACATRLRIDVKNPSLVSKKLLQETGAIGVITSGNNIQAVYGPKAGMIKTQVLEAYQND